MNTAFAARAGLAAAPAVCSNGQQRVKIRIPPKIAVAAPVTAKITAREFFVAITAGESVLLCVGVAANRVKLALVAEPAVADAVFAGVDPMFAVVDEPVVVDVAIYAVVDGPTVDSPSHVPLASGPYPGSH